MRAVFNKTLLEIAKKDKRIHMVLADIGYGEIEPFRDTFPERYYNVGVAEQNMTGVACGIAMEGNIAITYSIIAYGSDAEKHANVISGEDVLISGKSYRELSSVSGSDCYIGVFNYNGKLALYVVNASRNNRAKTTLKFNDKYRYNVIQRATVADVVGTELTLNMQPGEGVLIELK